jgi:hypothetical protein
MVLATYNLENSSNGPEIAYVHRASWPKLKSNTFMVPGPPCRHDTPERTFPGWSCMGTGTDVPSGRGYLH